MNVTGWRMPREMMCLVLIGLFRSYEGWRAEIRGDWGISVGTSERTAATAYCGIAPGPAASASPDRRDMKLFLPSCLPSRRFCGFTDPELALPYHTDI
ncbi:hypothetical protein V8F20_010467 [Naviculisporaceae sp. PSN 640]